MSSSPDRSAPAAAAAPQPVTGLGRLAPALPPGVDQLARVAVTETSLDELLQLVAEVAVATVPEAVNTSILRLDRRGGSTVASTGEIPRHVEAQQLDDDDGPCLLAAREQVLVHVPDTRAEQRWPASAAVACDGGALSMLSVPLQITPDHPGSLNLYAEQPGAFDDDAAEIALAFASYAGVVVRNAHAYDSARELAQNLQRAMESRAAIEQAKGIIMGERRCSPDDAFAVLVTLSQQTNRKLRDVAAALVEEASSPS